MSRVLIIDDDKMVRVTAARALLSHHHEVREAEDGAAGLALALEGTPDIILLDLDMPRMHGLEVLQRVRAGHGPPVIVMTALTDPRMAQEAERLGAERFLVKPLDLGDLVRAVERITSAQRRDDELSLLRSRSTYHDLVGVSPQMEQLFKTLAMLEDVDVSSVLLTGESGTGKDLVARAIHARGRRRDEPFVEVDCAALPETLVEATLFGHERGAFTDAKAMKRGLFEVAGGGTLFLDEVSEIPLGLQAKLLRALENRRFKRVGGTTDIEMSAAVIAATNRALPELVAQGGFRSDLFYRLNVFPIALPPLRERPEDVLPLAQHFVEKLAPRVGRPVVALSEAAAAALSRSTWPGNVRELRNVIERALILTPGGPIDVEALPSELRGDGAARPVGVATSKFVLPAEGINLEELERDLLRQALDRAAGNRTRAGRLLGISRHALAYRLKQLDDDGAASGDDHDEN